ncbi:MAG: hypothetical protein LUF92_06335 [Clostridiales bacterium]|nr:hypothetical protein [Clostridiales bacterium]
MSEDREISMSELILNILLKWRMLLLFMVIFGLLLGIYGGVKAYKNAGSAVSMEVEQEQSEDGESKYKSLLSEEEIDEVEYAAQQYLAYKKVYEGYKEYNSKSIEMLLDANALSTETIVYRVNAEEDAKDIRNVLVLSLVDDDLCQKALEATGWDSEPLFVQKMITVKDYYTSTGSSDVDFASEGDPSELLFVNITADSEENCYRIAATIDEKMDDISSDWENSYGTFSVEKITENYYVTANMSLLAEQQSNIEKMITAKTNLESLSTDFAGNQEAYYEELISAAEESSEGLEDEEIEQDAESAEETEEDGTASSGETVSVTRYINKKYILVGCVIGLFLACIYYLCAYLMDKHLLSTSCISDELGCPLLGTYAVEKKKKRFGDVIDRWLVSIFKRNERIFAEEEILQIVSAKIKVAAQKNDYSKIYVTSSTNTEEAKAFIEKMIRRFEQEEISLQSGDSIVYYADSLEQFAKTDAVLFVEQIDHSLVKEIIQELESCEDCKVSNLGFVVLT